MVTTKETSLDRAHTLLGSLREELAPLLGLVVSNVISAISTIVVARLLSPAEYGLVGVASTAPGSLLCLETGEDARW